MNIVQYLTFHDFFSVSNVALATPLENFPTVSHQTLVTFEANAAQPQVRRFLLRRIQLNARPLLRQPLDSLRQILRHEDRHDSQRLDLLLIQHESLRLGRLHHRLHNLRQILQQQDRLRSQRLGLLLTRLHRQLQRLLHHRLHSQLPPLLLIRLRSQRLGLLLTRLYRQLQRRLLRRLRIHTRWHLMKCLSLLKPFHPVALSPT